MSGQQRVSLALGMLMGLSTVATAAVDINFAAYVDAAGNGERGYGFGQTLGGNTTDLGGYTVHVYAWNKLNSTLVVDGNELETSAGDTNTHFKAGPATAVGGVVGPFAYGDSNTAGLGVGQILTSGLQVTPSDDDNVTGSSPLEVLGVSIQSDLQIEEFFFRDAGHGELNGGKVDITFDGGTNWETFTTNSSGKVVFGSPKNLSGGALMGFAYNNSQFYLSAISASQAGPTPIPEASTLASWLLMGLTGLGIARYRRRAA